MTFVIEVQDDSPPPTIDERLTELENLIHPSSEYLDLL